MSVRITGIQGVFKSTQRMLDRAQNTRKHRPELIREACRALRKGRIPKDSGALAASLTIPNARGQRTEFATNLFRLGTTISYAPYVLQRWMIDYKSAANAVTKVFNKPMQGGR